MCRRGENTGVRRTLDKVLRQITNHVMKGEKGKGRERGRKERERGKGEEKKEKEKRKGGEEERRRKRRRKGEKKGKEKGKVHSRDKGHSALVP